VLVDYFSQEFCTKSLFRLKVTMLANLLAFFVFVALTYASAPIRFATDGLEGRYIVVFGQNTSKAELAYHLDYFHDVHEVSFLYTYSLVLKGFAAKLTNSQLVQVSNHPAVDYIEQDQMAYASQCTSQNLRNEVWGLDRICKKSLPLNAQYIYPVSAGAGVDAYILDTGIYVEHNDFGGRAKFGWKAEPGWSDTDGYGHGTHVASTVGGSYYGVAKSVNLIAVKVLNDNGGGSIAGIIAGIDWAFSQKQSSGKPSVGNMSLGAPYNQAINDAVEAASVGGLVMVVSARNYGAFSDSCDYSPSSSSFVMAVGATTSSDIRASFSSVGTCVSIFAPGNDIPAAWIGNPDAINIISGTSMAAPHVTGTAALVLGQNPSFSFDRVKGEILSKAGRGLLNLNCGTSDLCNLSPNLMLHTNPCGPNQ